MAPPLSLFPVSDLENQVQITSANLKEKRRKLRDFDLEKCDLFELVQYTCTTPQQMMHPNARMECFPFVRLFRRCGQGEKMFHVETTAWEGEHAYEPPKEKTVGPVVRVVKEAFQPPVQQVLRGENAFAKYGSYFWSN